MLQLISPRVNPAHEGFERATEPFENPVAGEFLICGHFVDFALVGIV